MSLELFYEGLNHALKWEGPETNDPDDGGGHTKFGISKNSHPDVNISKLSLTEAQNIYLKEYWLHQFTNIDEKLALKLFDLCINPGVTTTIKIYQGVLKDYFKKNIVIDGVMGPITASASNTIENQESLYSAFIYEMSLHLQKVSKRRKNKKYFLGWLNRLYDHPRRKLFP